VQVYESHLDEHETAQAVDAHVSRQCRRCEPLTAVVKLRPPVRITPPHASLGVDS
jgi:hypothetical protein